MPVMDEFREEREAIRHAPFQKKLEYFKDYYLLATVVIVFAAAVGGAYLYSVLTAKQTALYAVLINFIELEHSTEEIAEVFTEAELNPKKETVVIDHSSYISADSNEINFLKYGYEDEQRLFSMVMTGDIDLFISGQDVVERYAEQEWFDDLTGILTEDILQRFEAEDRLFTFRGKPIGIRVDDSSVMKRSYYYNGKKGETVYACIPANSTHHETAMKFVQFLLNAD